MDVLKIIAGAIGLADFWSKYFGRKAEQETGAKLQKGQADAQVLDTISRVNRARSLAESDRMWNENRDKFGPVSGKPESN